MRIPRLKPGVVARLHHASHVEHVGAVSYSLCEIVHAEHAIYFVSCGLFASGLLAVLAEVMWKLEET